MHEGEGGGGLIRRKRCDSRFTLFAVEFEAKRFDEVQPDVHGGARASHVACVLRNLRVKQNDMEVDPLVLLPAACQFDRPVLLHLLLLLLQGCRRC